MCWRGTLQRIAYLVVPATHAGNPYLVFVIVSPFRAGVAGLAAAETSDIRTVHHQPARNLVVLARKITGVGETQGGINPKRTGDIWRPAGAASTGAAFLPVLRVVRRAEIHPGGQKAGEAFVTIIAFAGASLKGQAMAATRVRERISGVKVSRVSFIEGSPLQGVRPLQDVRLFLSVAFATPGPLAVTAEPLLDLFQVRETLRIHRRRHGIDGLAGALMAPGPTKTVAMALAAVSAPHARFSQSNRPRSAEGAFSAVAA